jgi:hypothetical protein
MRMGIAAATVGIVSVACAAQTPKPNPTVAAPARNPYTVITSVGVGEIGGVVIDNRTGTPISGVNVVMSSTPPRSVIGNDRGEFVIRDVVPSTYDIRVRRLGFLPRTVAVTKKENHGVAMTVFLERDTVPLTNVCVTYLDQSIIAAVRDREGRPAAIGVTMTAMRSGKVLFTAKGESGDSLYASTSKRAQGAFDLEFSKPWYAPTVIKGVQLNTDACGHGSIRLQATISLLPGAPPVRQIVVPSYGYGLGGGITTDLWAHVEAAPRVSREVAWLVRNPTLARVAPDGTITAGCTPHGGITWVIASSVVDPSVRDSIKVSVGASKDSDLCHTDGR